MKLLSVASARPNFVKLAAIDHACRLGAFSDVEHVIVHTGQHYDPVLSDVFFEELKITQPAHNLGVHGGSREEVIERTYQAILPVLKEEKPDIVLVYGDVNGAVGAARAAKELGMKLAHVEAGLRSGDLEMPEEHNRIEIDKLADVLFCSEKSGVDHLESEKVSGKIYLAGNTMIDTLERMMPEIKKKELGIAAKKYGRFAIATLHRPSNVDNRESLELCMNFLKEIFEHIPVILSAHPRLINALNRFDIPQPFVLHGPMEYLNFLRHTLESSFILTDSGGIQEEAVLLRKRCFTLRRNTERPVTIEVGSNVLIDPSNEAERATVLAFAEHPVTPAIKTPPLWDGKAGERIVDLLRKS